MNTEAVANFDRKIAVTMHARFVELVGEINSSTPDCAIAKVAAALNPESNSIGGCRARFPEPAANIIKT